MSAAWVQCTKARTLLSLEAEGRSNQEPGEVTLSGFQINRGPGEPGTEASLGMAEPEIGTKAKQALVFESGCKPVSDLGRTGEVIPDSNIVPLESQIVELDNPEKLEPLVAKPHRSGITKVESRHRVLGTDVETQLDPLGRSVRRPSIRLGPAVGQHEVGADPQVLAVPPTHEPVEDVEGFGLVLHLKLGANETVGLLCLGLVDEGDEDDESEKSETKHGDYPWFA